MKKFILTILLSLTTFVVFGQKPMVSFTVPEIKERNRMQFGTTEWETIQQKDYWVIYTVRHELMSMYFFKWGEIKNFMCTQATNSDELAREMYGIIINTYHNLGDNKFLHKENNLLVQYKYDEDLKSHSFLYFDPNGKKIFND